MVVQSCTQFATQKKNIIFSRDMIIAEFVRAVREDIDNTAGFNEKAEVREKFILDLHDYMKQISYVFLIMMVRFF